MTINKYILTGFDISTYCKITSVVKNDKTTYTISFGGGTYYCIIASINPAIPTEVYIDRVESNEKYEGETKNLLNIALWTIKSHFPHITKMTLNDDSHIDCTKGIKTHKLNLAYDYILKYNKTWYETHYNAKLPDELMEYYKKSLLILDKPVEPYETMKDKFNEVEKYKYNYEIATSPRDFINKLRIQYKQHYCFEVSRWLTRYMTSIRVDIFKEKWYINVSDIIVPPNYSIKETDANLRGGYRKLNKTMKNAKAFSFGPYEDGYSVGTYDTFE